MTDRGSVLITGCSDDGIGSGLAVAFQQQGYHVFATARSPDKMSKLKDLANVTLLTMDVTDKAQIDAAVEKVRGQTGGSLNYLVNNAGRNHFMPILDQDLDAARELYETNVLGPIAVTQAFAPLLIQAKGMLVFITSIAGYLHVPYMGTYAGTKRSLEIIAETLRLELAPFNVKVLSIVTGAVKTMGQTYFGDFKLPDGSLYKSIEGIIAARARGEDDVPRMGLAEYSNKVVTQIIQGQTSKFWCGENAESTKYASTHLESSALDGGLSHGIGERQSGYAEAAEDVTLKYQLPSVFLTTPIKRHQFANRKMNNNSNTPAGPPQLPPPANERTIRRNRTRLACTPCKIRKRKCDGGNPCATCTRYDYGCHYDKPPQPRKSAAALLRQGQYQDANAPVGTSPQELPAKSSPQNAGDTSNNTNNANDESHETIQTQAPYTERYMEANSGVLFPRTLGLKLNSRNNAQQGDCPGWNLGIRHSPRRSEKSIAWVLPYTSWLELCHVYEKRVHPIYGFLDLQTVCATAQRRWEDPHTTNEYDPVLCGVAALGSLFSFQANWEQERHLVECAKEILETSGTIMKPSIDDAAGWLLRTLYLRCSISPHAAWMASCIALHIIEATGIHQESATGVVSLVYADTATPPSSSVGHQEVETKRRIIWIARLLNTWISFEYGRSRVILRETSLPLPKPESRDGDYTSTLVSLFQISENLDPNNDIPAASLENLLEELEKYDFGVDALILSQSVLAFTIYRRLQLLGLSVNKTAVERVINLGRRGLEASRRCIDSNCPWWHVNNVPFQFTCILLVIDTSDSLIHVHDSVAVLKKVADHFRTPKSYQALETIELFVRLSQRRKEQDAALLAKSLLIDQTSEEGQEQQPTTQQSAVTNYSNMDESLLLPNGINNGLSLPDFVNPMDWEAFIRDPLDFSAAIF
ncbi:Protein RDR1 [Talaromyces islandicus]|uniref:Protein RDR1 n=1 Tax=Talaromyces islandicus TaxID=28573 RepID=A0A0U1LPA5_TALIS|nr:Protein RDR1 [Talaromyces islandicus]